MGNNDNSGEKSAPPVNLAREAKLARALRDNLKRRKAAGKAASAAGPASKSDGGESS